MSKDIFRNSNGDLSVYALNCGYIQSATTPDDRFTVKLFADGVYHVRITDAEMTLGWTAWESFDTLREARRAYRKALKHYSTLGNADPDSEECAATTWAN